MKRAELANIDDPAPSSAYRRHRIGVAVLLRLLTYVLTLISMSRSRSLDSRRNRYVFGRTCEVVDAMPAGCDVAW